MRSVRNTFASSGAPLLLACLAAGACGDEHRPVLAIVNSAAYVDAATFAIADFDAAGMGNGTVVDTLLRREGSNRAMEALRTAEAFVSTAGVVAVVGHSNSAASLAASQIYNERQVVQLAPTTSAVAYSDAGAFSFRLVPPDDRQGRFLATRIDDLLPPDATVALLYVNDDYGRGLRRAFLDGIAELQDPPRIVLDLPHTDDLPRLEVAQRHHVEAVARSGADVVVWLSRAFALNELLPALRDRVGDVPIIGGDAVASALSLPVVDDRWAGVRYVSFVDLAATPAGRQFVRRYQHRFGVEPDGSHALTYDATSLVLTALADGARSGPEIRDYLGSIGRERPPYEGVTGRIAFDDKGNVDRSYRLAAVAPTVAP